MLYRRGFTIVELLAVMAIIGILAAIALPRYAGTSDKARVAALRADLRNAETAEETFYTDNGVYGDLPHLTAAGLLAVTRGDTIVVTSGPSGYQLRAANMAINSTINSCSVQVGAGTTMDTDGAISCP